MQNIKILLYESLTGFQDSLTGVQAIKEYNNKEKAIDNCEQMVFADSGIALSDYSYTRELYGIGVDKIRHKIVLLYFIKSQTGYNDFIFNSDYICKQWRNNNFGVNTIVMSSINISNEFNIVTDRIQYVEMEFNCVEINEIA